MYVNRLHLRAVTRAVLALGFAFASAGPLLAQATRVGTTQFPQGTEPVRRFPAVAYDEVNNAYLVAWGLSTVGARFVSADGIPLSNRETVSTGFGGATRVACGAGKCLIVWVQEPYDVVGRLVRYNGGAVQMLTGIIQISATAGISKLLDSAPSVAYSSQGSGEFLVAWAEAAPWPVTRIMGRRVTPAGTPTGGEIPIAYGDSFQSRPSLTYNSTAHEYVMAHQSENAAQYNIVKTKRIQPGTGTVLGSGNLQGGVFEQYPEIAYNSVNDQFLVISWFSGSGWILHGHLANSAAQPIGTMLTLGFGVGGDGIGLAYNSKSNSYLAVTQGTSNDEVWGVNISASGTAGNKFQVTVSGAAGSIIASQPQIAGSTKDSRWLSAAIWGNRAVMSQLLQSGGGTPPASTLVSPTGTVNTALPTYTWRAAAGATMYYLWVTDSSGTPRVQSWYSAASACGGTSTCTATPGTALAAGNATWWVQTWNPSGYGPWSSGMTFNIGRIAPTALSPSGTVSASPILFTWSAVPGATMYYIWINDQTGVKFQSWILASAACVPGASTCSVNATPHLYAGPGVWWIEAWTPGVGYSPWSAPRTFTIAPFTATATPVAPTGVLGGSTVEFSWLPATGATHYYLWVNDSTGPRFQQWFEASQACPGGGGLCFQTVSPSLGAGAGTWWVQGWSTTGGYGPWSSPLTFVR